jgi:hypothetical protein
MILKGRRLKRARKAKRNGSRITAFVWISATATDGMTDHDSGRIRLFRARKR